MLSKGLLSLATMETFSPARLERAPITTRAVVGAEGELLQNEEEYARSLQGMFHYCALASSRLVPEHGVVLDLACGSGGFARTLAERRPDISIIGVDSEQALVDVGQELITLAGLQERINLNLGELTNISQRIPGEVDLVTCVLGLNTLASTDELMRCFKEISMIRIRNGAAAFVLDFCRPNLAKTADEFASVLMPGSLTPFRRTCRVAATAAFNFQEMSEAFERVAQGVAKHQQSKNLKIFQAHWLEREDGLIVPDLLWQEGRIAGVGLQQFRDVCSMFPKVPLPKHMK